MQSADIQTSHNIVISFPLANWLQRLLANIIDLFLLYIYIMIIATTLSGLPVLMYLFGFIVVAFYHFFCEVFNKGQSLGKKLLQIRVIDIHGRTPSIEAYFMRWIFRLIDNTFSFGILASLFIVSTENKQRLGDILAQTLVVSLKNQNVVTLESIENLKINIGEIEYPKIVQYSDKDMLLVKQALNRHNAHPSTESQALLVKLTERIADRMGINDQIKNNVAFLKKVLYEYIILTR